MNIQVIHITLKCSYDKNEKVITGLKRISKQVFVYTLQARMYLKLFGGLGTAIIFHKPGVITDKAAKLGGESSLLYLVRNPRATCERCAAKAGLSDLPYKQNKPLGNFSENLS